MNKQNDKYVFEIDNSFTLEFEDYVNSSHYIHLNKKKYIRYFQKIKETTPILTTETLRILSNSKKNTNTLKMVSKIMLLLLQKKGYFENFKLPQTKRVKTKHTLKKLTLEEVSEYFSVVDGRISRIIFLLSFEGLTFKQIMNLKWDDFRWKLYFNHKKVYGVLKLNKKNHPIKKETMNELLKYYNSKRTNLIKCPYTTKEDMSIGVFREFYPTAKFYLFRIDEFENEEERLEFESKMYFDYVTQRIKQPIRKYFGVNLKLLELQTLRKNLYELEKKKFETEIVQKIPSILEIQNKTPPFNDKKSLLAEGGSL